MALRHTIVEFDWTRVFLNLMATEDVIERGLSAAFQCGRHINA